MEKRYVMGFNGELSTELKSGRTYFVEADIMGCFEYKESDIREITFESELPDWYTEYDREKYEYEMIDDISLGHRVYFTITCKPRESTANFIKRAKGMALELMIKEDEREDAERTAELNSTLYIRSYMKDDKLMNAEVFPYSEASRYVIDMCDHNGVEFEDGVYTVYFTSQKSLNTARIEGISRMYIAKSKKEF